MRLKLHPRRQADLVVTSKPIVATLLHGYHLRN